MSFASSPFPTSPSLSGKPADLKVLPPPLLFHGLPPPSPLVLFFQVSPGGSNIPLFSPGRRLWQAPARDCHRGNHSGPSPPGTRSHDKVIDTHEGAGARALPTPSPDPPAPPGRTNAPAQEQRLLLRCTHHKGGTPAAPHDPPQKLPLGRRGSRAPRRHSTPTPRPRPAPRPRPHRQPSYCQLPAPGGRQRPGAPGPPRAAPASSPLTERHLARLAQLGVMRLLHFLVGQDLLQRPRQEHVLGLLALIHGRGDGGGAARGSLPAAGRRSRGRKRREKGVEVGARRRGGQRRGQEGAGGRPGRGAGSGRAGLRRRPCEAAPAGPPLLRVPGSLPGHHHPPVTRPSGLGGGGEGARPGRRRRGAEERAGSEARREQGCPGSRGDAHPPRPCTGLHHRRPAPAAMLGGNDASRSVRTAAEEEARPWLALALPPRAPGAGRQGAEAARSRSATAARRGLPRSPQAGRGVCRVAGVLRRRAGRAGPPAGVPSVARELGSRLCCAPFSVWPGTPWAGAQPFRSRSGRVRDTPARPRLRRAVCTCSCSPLAALRPRPRRRELTSCESRPAPPALSGRVLSGKEQTAPSLAEIRGCCTFRLCGMRRCTLGFRSLPNRVSSEQADARCRGALHTTIPSRL